jgi:hypothetical protein
MNDAESFLRRVYTGPIEILRLREQTSVRHANDPIAAAEVDPISSPDRIDLSDSAQRHLGQDGPADRQEGGAK